MSVLWLIIKVILFILLILFLCLAFFMALLLLAPIKYSCFYESYDKASYRFKIRMLRLIEGNWALKDDVQESHIKILGFHVYGQGTDDFKEAAEEKLSQASEETQAASKKAVKKTTHKKLSHETFFGKLSSIKELLSDERFSVFLHSILTALRRVLKTLKPYFIWFELIIGKEDPADTGELIAGLSLLFPWYYPYGMIAGNYDEKGLWGSVQARGRFRLITLVHIVIRLMMHKETREYLYLLINTGKESGNGSKA